MYDLLKNKKELETKLIESPVRSAKHVSGLPQKQIELEDRLFRSKSRRRALLQTPSKKFKGDSRYTGSDNKEDDFNDFSMNKGFIQYDL